MVWIAWIGCIISPSQYNILISDRSCFVEAILLLGALHVVYCVQPIKLGQVLPRTRTWFILIGQFSICGHISLVDHTAEGNSLKVALPSEARTHRRLHVEHRNTTSPSPTRRRRSWFPWIKMKKLIVLGIIGLLFVAGKFYSLCKTRVFRWTGPACVRAWKTRIKWHFLH